MSALPLLEEAPVIRPQRPVQRPGVPPRRKRTSRPVVRPRSMPKQQVRKLEVLTERALLFCGVAVAVFMVSSLLGHVMVEKSRREGIAALSRLREASKAESLLQERVYAISNIESVQAWALQNGFVAPEDSMKSLEKTLVARR